MSQDDEIFAAALELPPAERSAFLLQTCQGDEALRDRVEALLKGHGLAGSFLREPILPREEIAPKEIPAETIGRYKLLGKIGEGGCGVVYEAEQQEPVRRRVALKVIKLGMDTNAVIARFQAERQALALMDHPNIARVYDAGATDTGRPYFVMELVRGIPITAYCDRNHLTPRQRIELFIAVCSAVQHAHGKGIVHRDLKPSNILVSLIDGVPVPKVIDFGVAKATQGRLTDATMYTAFEQFIGTPMYMSPEQADLGGLDIDSRSDIYSLGVLLYELLAGRLPFDDETFAKGGVDAVRRQIREVEPPTPSTRVRTLTEADRATVAKSRGTAPAGLSPLLRGDLDWIVMRCLEKDRTRRYQTAAELALDLQRCLRHEAVAARPPSPIYVLGKFIRRHRTGFMAAASAALALGLGAAVSVWEAGRADRAERRQSQASEAPELAARAQGIFTDVYATADDFAAAEALLRRALALDPSDGKIWAISSELNSQEVGRGFDLTRARLETARRQAEQALKLAPDSAEAWLARAHTLQETDPPEAERAAQRALALAPEGGRLHSQILFRLAGIVLRKGDAEAAFRFYGDSSDPSANPGSDALAHYNQFLIRLTHRRFAEADALSAEAAAELPSANFICGRALSLLMWHGDAEQAAATLNRIEEVRRSEPRTIFFIAYTALLRRRPQEALDALATMPADYVDDNFFSSPRDYLEGMAQAEMGHDDAARLDWEQGLAVCQKKDQERTPGLGALIIEAEMLGRLGRTADARRLIRAIEEKEGGTGPNPELGWRADTVRAYAALGDAEAALPRIRWLLANDRSAGGWVLTPAILRLDPIWDRIRSDPRFQALAQSPLVEGSAPAAAGSEQGPGRAPQPQPAATPAAAESAALTAEALAHCVKLGFLREDLALAEDMARRATELESDSAAAWGARAAVQAAWLQRYWDMSAKRREEAQTYANRALALDPSQPEALIALSYVLSSQGAYAQAEAVLRRAIAAHPKYVRMKGSLAHLLALHGNRARKEEARALLREALRLAPRDPIIHYEMALTYASYGEGGDDPATLAKSLEELDAAIATQPFSSALLLKATLIGGWRGDLQTMRTVLDQGNSLPLADRSDDRAVCVAMWAGLIEHRPDRVEASAALTARDYFEDSIMPLRPKAWPLALAHRLAGKDNLSRRDWEDAESVLRRRLRDQPDNNQYQAELAVSLAWLGQREEAARLIGVVEPLWQEAPHFWTTETLALYYGATGNAKRAAPYLAATLDHSPFWSRRIVPLDPWWDKLRGQPAFDALLKAPLPAR